MFRPTFALLVALLAAPALALAAPPPAGGYHGGYYGGYRGGYYGGYRGGYYGGYSGLYAPGYFSRNYYRPYYPGVGAYYAPAYAYPPVYAYESGATEGYLPPGPAGPAPSDNTASVGVRVPSDAEVWFNGDPTKQKGEEREFATPPLAPGGDYQYEVRARWTENGKPVDQTRTVVVHANARSEVDFTRPEPPAPPAKP